MSTQPATSERRAISLFRRDIVTRALLDSFAKLDPRVQIRNPVMFVVEMRCGDHDGHLVHPARRRPVTRRLRAVPGSPSRSRSGCG